METPSKIIVTGGAGFIGSHLVDRLIKDGHAVIVIDNLFAGRPSHIHPSVLRAEQGSRFYQMDIRDNELHRVFEIEKPDYVFHLAGQIDLRLSVLDPLHDIDINIIGGINLLKNCVRYKVKKVIFASSGGAIYGELPPELKAFPHNYTPAPVSPYGHSKLVFEQHLHYAHQAYGIDFVALRFANVFGPRQEASRECGVISIFTQAFLHNEQPYINGDGSQTRDLVYVTDCVDAAVRALQSPESGVFNIGTTKATTISELFDMLVQATGKPMEKKYRPAKKGDVAHSCIDYSVSKQVLGWEPSTSVQQGIQAMIDWANDEKIQHQAHENELLYQTLSPHQRCRHWLHGSY